MDQETIYWTIGLSLTLLMGLSVSVGMYIVELFNSGQRKAKRDLKNKRKKIEKERRALNKLNLDGVEIVRFADFYRKRLDNDYIMKEYKAVLDRFIPKTLSSEALKKKRKNLFDKYVPFEHNIVTIESQRKFYINASWIPGVRGTHHYIATQVPLKKTILDFWTMIWYYECYVIMMIGEELSAKLPDTFDYTNPKAYPPLFEFSIEIENSYVTMDFRILTMKLSLGRSQRLITHIQFLTWTTIRMTKPMVILELRRQMKKAVELNGGPIVVHCITGCGRTGTFISIANLCDFVDKCKEDRRDEKISVPHEVIRIRENRIMTVANIAQYSMIYETLIQYVVGGITAIPLEHLQNEMSLLSVKSATNCMTKFQRQFMNTNRMTEKLALVDCAGGLRDENIDKNRHPLIIPRDNDRPYMKNIKMKGTSDYINGVYIDSFTVRNHFIVTQWPMENTINDVWRLLFDKNIQVMVLLNVFENSKKYRQFWPTILNQRTGSGPISVELVEDTILTQSIRCQIFNLEMINFEMKISDVSLLQSKGLTVKKGFGTEKVSWKVAFFHLLNWKNDNHVPDELHDIINLIWLTEEYNLSSGFSAISRSPIVVMSEDGVKRAGTYCVVAACLERMRLYGDVDVYSAVLNVKKNRPELICDMDEYLLCYELCLEYLLWSEQDDDNP